MGMTAICVVAGIGALMAHFYSLDAPVDFDVSSVGWFHATRRGFEEAELHFNISADLSSLVHVNTRHFYSYIFAEWGESDTDSHKSILWDRLITRENPRFIETDVNSNFTLRQVGQTIRGKPVKLTFRIQLIPFVGFFRTKDLATRTFTLPRAYSDI